MLAAAAALFTMTCVRAESGGMGLAADGCITAACHSGMMGKKFVHGPVAVGDCLHCHKKTGDHRFQTALGNGEMCFVCHEETSGGKNILCIVCHDPHGTDAEFQLRAGVGETCKK